MQIKSTTENPTRKASARAMRLPPWLVVFLLPLRIMKKRAEAKLAKMAINARATRYFMLGIIS